MPLDSTATGLMAATGDWTVLLDQPVPALSGVLPALAARHASGRRGFALACRPDLPPRLGALTSLGQAQIDGLVLPQALLPARLPRSPRETLLAVMPLPPGPPILTAQGRCRPWSESELVHDLLRPVARVLAALEARSVTHRGVRVENLFRTREGGPCILGDGFCLPPAFLQPAWTQPPALAQCVPEGRGNGQAADDIFALGVAIVCVAAGRVPWAGTDPRALHMARLERGSFTALTADLRLPGTLADLLRAMLADEADLRPDAQALVAWPSGMQVRKGAARPVRRAGRPLPVGQALAHDTRTAAWLLAANWTEGIRTVRGEALDGFLRRGVGDPALAERLAEAARTSGSDPLDVADDLLLCRAIAMLDPQAPLCWRGVAMMPDGLGPMLARAVCDEEHAALKLADLVAMVGAEAPARWAFAGSDAATAATLSRSGAQWRVWLRATGLAGGVERLLYQTNPGLCCLSPLLHGAWAATPAALLAALEAASPEPGSAGAGSMGAGPPPPDHHVASFLAARNEAGLERLLAGVSGPPAQAIAARVAALARLQARFAADLSLPRLAAWLAAAAQPALETWRSRTMRAGLPARLAEVAGAGDLSALHALLDDPGARQMDAEGAAGAEAEMAAIEAELAAIANGAPARRQQARATGEQVAASISLSCLLGVAMWLLAGV
jgi:hypothetical protein